MKEVIRFQDIFELLDFSLTPKQQLALELLTEQWELWEAFNLV
jgi:hypothetical protein